MLLFLDYYGFHDNSNNTIIQALENPKNMIKRWLGFPSDAPSANAFSFSRDHLVKMCKKNCGPCAPMSQ